MILILLGPPGAGKGTQAKLLAREYGLPHISTGDMFRDHKARKTELGLRIQAIMDSGELVTDDITNDLVAERLSRPDVAKGFILDGYPRTAGQAEYLERLLTSMGRKVDRALSYTVPEGLIIERVSGRRSCPTCGTTYHLWEKPARRAGFCDKDSSQLIQREDDQPHNVKIRMREYAEKTAPLKRFYEERGLVTEIDGVGTPQGILGATRAALYRYE